MSWSIVIDLDVLVQMPMGNTSVLLVRICSVYVYVCVCVRVFVWMCLNVFESRLCVLSASRCVCASCFVLRVP